MENHNRET